MMSYYTALKGRIKMLIFSGDDDSVCATLGTQQFLWDLGLPIVSDWAPWTLPSGPGCPHGPACEQVAGYVTLFDGLSFVTVHGAGHLVPATRPTQGLHVLRNFLNGTW
jgi:carboxypeptidase C (cathepsin A)